MHGKTWLMDTMLVDPFCISHVGNLAAGGAGNAATAADGPYKLDKYVPGRPGSKPTAQLNMTRFSFDPCVMDATGGLGGW